MALCISSPSAGIGISWRIMLWQRISISIGGISVMALGAGSISGILSIIWRSYRLVASFGLLASAAMLSTSCWQPFSMRPSAGQHQLALAAANLGSYQHQQHRPGGLQPSARRSVISGLVWRRWRLAAGHQYSAGVSWRRRSYHQCYQHQR